MAVNTVVLQKNETVFEAQVESIATGGAGVAHLDGRAVFIPKTAPGDTIRFRIVKDKGKYLLGELLRIIQTGPARTPPPCAHWSDCGGCALQHIETPAQMEAKKRIFLDTLTRIGKIELGVPVQTITLLKMRTATACARDFRYGVLRSAFSPRAQGVCPESKTVCWWSPPSRTPSTRSDICSRRSRKRGKWKPWK